MALGSGLLLRGSLTYRGLTLAGLPKRKRAAELHNRN